MPPFSKGDPKEPYGKVVVNVMTLEGNVDVRPQVQAKFDDDREP